MGSLRGRKRRRKPGVLPHADRGIPRHGLAEHPERAQGPAWLHHPEGLPVLAAGALVALGQGAGLGPEHRAGLGGYCEKVGESLRPEIRLLSAPQDGRQSMGKEDNQQDYGHFLGVIKKSIRAHQLRAMRAVNRELVGLYWEIGKEIQKKQEQLGWGKAVVETLAMDLQTAFPGRSGFSARNLWNMRNLYATYSTAPKLQQLVAELAWGANLLIMRRCKEELEREFYLKASVRHGWTRDVLRHQLDNKTYEKYLLSQSSFEQALPEGQKAQAILAVKDHYNFEFLELAEEHSERDLERALLQNLRKFLTELGSDFAFLGNQYRLDVGGQEYFLDLLLFHRRLRSLVAVELKIGEFKPEHKGKMEFYLEALDAQERVEGENPPIGILVCRSKNINRSGVCPTNRLACHRRGQLLRRAAAARGLPRPAAQPRGDCREIEVLVGEFEARLGNAQVCNHSAAKMKH